MKANFKQKLNEFRDRKRTAFYKMFYFGEEMRRAMGLSTEDLEDVHDMVWNIAGFQLAIRSFPQNGWKNTIIVSPTGMNGNKIGYSNTKESPPEKWYYSAGGTATVFYPPESVQNEILKRIKEFVE